MPADFGSLALAGSGLGCAGFTVLDDSTSILQVAQAVARFPTWSAASARPASTGLAWPRARSTRSSMRRGEPRPLGTRAHCGLRRTPGKPVLPTGPGLDPHPEPAEIVQGGIREPDREPRVRLPWSGRSARSLTSTGRPGPSATIRTSAIGGRTGPTASSPRRVIPRASGLSRRPLRETAMAGRPGRLQPRPGGRRGADGLLSRCPPPMPSRDAKGFPEAPIQRAATTVLDFI